MHRGKAAIVAATMILGAGAPRIDQLDVRAERLARALATACPAAQYDTEAAFEACGRALLATQLPLGKAVAWGGDQPDKQIKNKRLTHLSSQVFRAMYLPLFAFTGRWSLDEDKLSHSPIIRVEAYSRNALPAGDFPYPFWHSADKWNAYEAANEPRFYVDPDGQAVVVTRGAPGNEDRRGRYAHVKMPAFDGVWQWFDADGHLQPRVSLFGAYYSRANPTLPDLDKPTARLRCEFVTNPALIATPRKIMRHRTVLSCCKPPDMPPPRLTT